MITGQQVDQHLKSGPNKEVVAAVRKVLPQRNKFSSHLTAFVDHGRITKSVNYVANELNALLGEVKSDEPSLWERLFGGLKPEPAVEYKSAKDASTLVKEYTAKKAGWMPRDVVPKNYEDTVQRLESWRIALESKSGMALTLVHSLRGSANKTNLRSNHRPENGGTAADFQPIGVKWSDTVALALLKAAESIKQPVNQLLIEPSDKGGVIVHIDVKAPGKSDKRIASKYGKTIAVKGAREPTAKPSAFKNDVADFVDMVMTSCFKYKRLDGLSRRCVSETLRIESGNVIGKALRLNVVNPLGYCGPFQFGLVTWNGVANQAGVSKFSTKADFKAACLSGVAGGPGDPVANAHALAAYWDVCAAALEKAFGGQARERIVADDFGMYIAHQQGAQGAVHFLKTGNLLFPRQSAESVKMMRAARERLKGVL